MNIFHYNFRNNIYYHFEWYNLPRNHECLSIHLYSLITGEFE